MRHVPLPLLGGALLLAWLGCAQPRSDGLPPATARQIDQLFERWNRPDSPGCAAGVARGGRLVYARGFGSADLDHRIPIRPSTVFPVGSNSKQFTAMVVALLAEDGVLSLDDDVRRWVPELPVYSRPITVRDLLHHTSGLRDYNALRFLSGTPPDWIDLDQVLALLARQRSTHFPAGEKFEYSNSGYVLARVVAERASGRSLRQLAREKIFVPLGMRSTTWDETGRRVVHDRATPFTAGGREGWRRAFGATLAGSGGLWTTIEDLTRWDESFYHHRLGKKDPELVRRALEPSPPSLEATRGAPEDSRGGYGFGIFLGRHHGRPIEWHAGRGPGYVADVARYPQEHVAVFCLCNATIDTRLLARAIGDLVLGAPAAKPATSPAPVSAQLSAPPVAAALADYAGTYDCDELDNPYTLDVVGAALRLRTRIQPKGTLALAGPDRFVLPTEWFTLLFHFTRDRRGRVIGFRLDSGAANGFWFARRAR